MKNTWIDQKKYTFIYAGEVLFTIVFLVLFFQDPLQNVLSPFSVLDEAYAVLCPVLFLIELARHDLKYTFSPELLIFLVVALLFCSIGWISYFRNPYQPLTNALKDSIVLIKFFLGIGTTWLLFHEFNIEMILKRSYGLVKFLTLLMAVFSLVDEVVGLHPNAEIRWGVRTASGMFTLHTVQAIMACYFCAIHLKMYQYYKDAVLKWLLLTMLVALGTVRMKAIGEMVLVAIIYMVVCKGRRRPGFFTIAGGGGAVLLLAAKQLNAYFGTDSAGTARYMLTTTAPKIAKDYFPFGSGLATFGSAFSIEPYSYIYRKYHLNSVWGLQAKFSSFVSDTFWPYIIGELGWSGFICYVCMLILLGVGILKMAKKNAYSFASALVVFTYLLISSTAESAYANYVAMVMAFWLGILFSER